VRQHLKMSGTSYRIDETYFKVGTKWKYLYRAIDSSGNTIEFMLSAKRDISAAKRFFKKMMRADHRRLPFTIGTDKHASYPEAFASSIEEKVLPVDCKLRRVKISQQHHRTRPPGGQKAMEGDAGACRSFHTAERTLEGIEAMHMMRKGQVKRLAGSDAIGQASSLLRSFRWPPEEEPSVTLCALKYFSQHCH
jgi:transposase, IS6 family